MADYHILTMDKDKDQITVVYHILIPAAATNFNSLTYRQAIVERDAPVSVLPNTFGGIDITAHKAEIANGVYYEIQKVIQLDANLNNAAKKAFIDADYTATKTATLNELQNTLTFWGYETNVA